MVLSRRTLNPKSLRIIVIPFHSVHWAALYGSKTSTRKLLSVRGRHLGRWRLATDKHFVILWQSETVGIRRSLMHARYQYVGAIKLLNIHIETVLMLQYVSSPNDTAKDWPEAKTTHSLSQTGVSNRFLVILNLGRTVSMREGSIKKFGGQLAKIKNSKPASLCSHKADMRDPATCLNSKNQQGNHLCWATRLFLISAGSRLIMRQFPAMPNENHDNFQGFWAAVPHVAWSVKTLLREPYYLAMVFIADIQ